MGRFFSQGAHAVRMLAEIGVWGTVSRSVVQWCFCQSAPANEVWEPGLFPW